ncbi:hydrogenase maturation nickel metallochaperone HypA [Streptomyces sp. ID05-04B]|uniref:hydrogenase maturation nickel metallochaperone HypA/HybF n=1 Tax=unclassified Streptomyces TaxID=2593676 RepID=UPI000D1B3745|nr:MULTISPECIES: hydrogenase maturation nickel metallochaperone HypA [unclassified Streptomyces]AVV44081.1 hydrogenase maturation nickel metallochaperone HypA [Streptomyces sp. P3]MDX5564514.1 hydrogenase maturation nickel metallochaperone HypA [Streptomyces sp. ID05-04B]
MHEMSVALAVVDQVAEAAGRSAGVTAVRSVRLRVGELAGVVPDALAFSFELACAGTLLEGAELITEAVPGRARCTPCAHEWAVGMPPRLTCPACGATHTELLAGRELQIVDVRWEDGPPHASPREPISEER